MQSQQDRINRILTTILTESDRRIYSIIKEYPCTKKDLTNRTKFPTNLLDKILKQLSSYNLVKSIKRPESKNMNVWVLYNHKQDDDQVEQIADKDDLMNFIRKKQNSILISELQKDAIRKGVKIDNFQKVITIMQARGQIYIVNGSVMKRQTNIINTPCIQCKLKDICTPEGLVNPGCCPYIVSW